MSEFDNRHISSASQKAFNVFALVVQSLNLLGSRGGSVDVDWNLLYGTSEFRGDERSIGGLVDLMTGSSYLSSSSQNAVWSGFISLDWFWDREVYQGGRKFLSEIRPRSDIVKTTLDFYNSLSKNNTGPLCEWVDDPHGLVNSCIELRVPNSDSFMMFTVNGYYNGFHLIESFAFKALRSEVDLTLLPSGSIRQTGDRVFLSEIVPQSDIMDAVKELADEVTEAADAQSDIVDAVKELADEVAEAADAQIDIVDAVKELGDEVTEAYLDRIRRRYIAEKYKKRDELAEVARKLALETQQRDWEKQQKEKKEQRKLKKAQKSKKEEQKKKKK
ncbi:Uncharacterized protein Rs2_31731 [Raphanus sativus]|nr:Uncharacterized protein Rs2_31731 [Raphanus sativus]